MKNLNHEEKLIQTFRKELNVRGLNKIESEITDEEIFKLLNASILPIAMSSTKMKNTIFHYTIIQNDLKKEIDMIKFFQLSLKFKKKLSIYEKRIIKYFLINGAKEKPKEAFESFIQTFGKGKTYFDKINSQKEYIRFRNIYTSYIKHFVNKLKFANLKKFPNLNISED